MSNTKSTPENNPAKAACCGACDCTTCSCGCPKGECHCQETDCECGCRPPVA